MFYCDFTNVSVWARSIFVLNKCQVFIGPWQFRKNFKRKLFRDDTDKLVPRLGQLMTPGFYFGFTMVLPELVRLLSSTSANILPALEISEKISSQGCLAMTRTILSQDSVNWWQHPFCCEFASISTNANHYLSQSLTVAWLIFGSSSTSDLSLATGPVRPVTSWASMLGPVQNIETHWLTLGRGSDGCPKSAYDWHSCMGKDLKARLTSQ